MSLKNNICPDGKSKCVRLFTPDLVTTILQNHAKSIPPSDGYTKNEFSWRDSVRSLKGKKLNVEVKRSSVFVNYSKDLVKNTNFESLS